MPLTEIEAIRWWAEILLAGELKDGRVNNDDSDVVIRSLCSQARDNFTIEETARLAAALRDIRGKTQGLGQGTSAHCIFETDNGHIQFMADVDSQEYLCEIQSHHYCAAVEPKLTDDVVTLIADGGFYWPQSRQNFSRWFRVSTDADVDALAESSLGILNKVFEHQSGNDLALTVHLP